VASAVRQGDEGYEKPGVCHSAAAENSIGSASSAFARRPAPNKSAFVSAFSAFQNKELSKSLSPPAERGFTNVITPFSPALIGSGMRLHLEAISISFAPIRNPRAWARRPYSSARATPSQSLRSSGEPLQGMRHSATLPGPLDLFASHSYPPSQIRKRYLISEPVHVKSFIPSASTGYGILGEWTRPYGRFSKNSLFVPAAL
jgi:hypothetical protein